MVDALELPGCTLSRYFQGLTSVLWNASSSSTILINYFNSESSIDSDPDGGSSIRKALLPTSHGDLLAMETRNMLSKGLKD